MKRFRLTAPHIALTESHVARACLDLLRYHRYRPVRLQSGLFPAPDKLCDRCRAEARWIRVGEVGMPDYCVPAFFLETKRPDGQLSAEQKAKISELEMHDVPVAVVDSVEGLLAWLDHYERNGGGKK